MEKGGHCVERGTMHKGTEVDAWHVLGMEGSRLVCVKCATRGLHGRSIGSKRGI